MSWFALHTRYHHETHIAESLRAKGLQYLLPVTRVTWNPGGKRRFSATPLFPGYLFVNCEMTKERYFSIICTPGVLRVLANGYDHLVDIPEPEMESLAIAGRHDTEMAPVEELPSGSRVRISRGPLAGITGILTARRERRSSLILSVNLLNRGAQLEIDSADVEPCQIPACNFPIVYN